MNFDHITPFISRLSLFVIIFLITSGLNSVYAATPTDSSSVVPGSPTPRSQITNFQGSQTTYSWTPSDSTQQLCPQANQVLVGYNMGAGSYTTSKFTSGVHYNLVTTEYNNNDQSLMSSVAPNTIVCQTINMVWQP